MMVSGSGNHYSESKASGKSPPGAFLKTRHHHPPPKAQKAHAVARKTKQTKFGAEIKKSVAFSSGCQTMPVRYIGRAPAASREEANTLILIGSTLTAPG
jgi:hypothetical protein